MNSSNTPATANIARDLTAGLVVFLVALPLCLGIALASNAPLFSGLVAGLVGGILVGVLSGSQSSVSGPAAGLTAVVAAQIMTLGSFPAFLLAVVVAGVIQIGLGLAKAGFLSAFFPSSVIKGLLAAIGVLLILKQLPPLFGHDSSPQGSLAFNEPGQQNTFTQLFRIIGNLHYGAAFIGVLSFIFLYVWDHTKSLKKFPVPAPLLVVLLGVALSLLFKRFGEGWSIGKSHLVDVPVAESAREFLTFLQLPDFSQWRNPQIYVAAVTIAIVASLETLLNLQAVDRIDPLQRTSPPSRELWAQGIGNVVSGLAGGLPVTSVIVRSSVNINAGGRTKVSAVFHGILLLVCVMFLAEQLNMIPLSCLAAILLVTGIKLASPKLVRQLWSEGKYQFAPFVITVVAIVLTDLLKGVVIGLVVSLSFILWSNLRRPIRTIVEKHLGGDVIKIDLANQVSFLNRAALDQTLDEVPAGGHVLLDASHTDYIDPDILDLIRDYKNDTAPARGIEVSLLGFRSKYQLHDRIQYVDYSTRELQAAVTPAQVLDILKSGHERFQTGEQLTRDYGRQVTATAGGEHPLAVVLSCVDSRTPTELIFDLGVGDIFSVRIAGNVLSRKVLGSVEYGCAIAGAKLVLVMGHTRCSAVAAAVQRFGQPKAGEVNCPHFDFIVNDIYEATDAGSQRGMEQFGHTGNDSFIDTIARRNVARAVTQMREQSPTLEALVRDQRIAIVGAMYDVVSGKIEFLPEPGTTARP